MNLRSTSPPLSPSSSPYFPSSILSPSPKTQHASPPSNPVYVSKRLWHRDPEIEHLIRTSLLSNNTNYIFKLLQEHHLNPNTKIPLLPQSSQKKPLIYFAAKKGHLEMVKLLVKWGASVKTQDPFTETGDETSMMVSIEKGHDLIVEYLLQMGANPNGIFSARQVPHTFLSKASIKGYLRVVDVLISYKAHIEKALVSLASRLINRISLSQDKLEINYIKSIYYNAIKILLNYSVGHNFTNLSFLKGLDISGFNFLGVSLNGVPVSRKFLEAEGLTGADKAIITPNDLKRTSGLQKFIIRKKVDHVTERRMCFVQTDDDEVDLASLKQTITRGTIEAIGKRLDHMIGRGKKVNKYYELEGQLSYTPLHLAIFRGSLDIVQLLLRRGANPFLPANQHGKVISSIQLAKNCGFEEIVEHLTFFDTHPQEAFYRAIEWGYKGIVDTILTKENKDLNTYDEFEGGLKYTPLHLAILSGSLDMVHFLLQKGTNPALAAYQDDTVLSSVQLAKKHGFEQIAEHLMLFETYSNETLSRAIEWGYTGLVTHVLLSRVDAHHLFKGPFNLLAQAALQGHRELVKLLIQYGGAINEAFASLINSFDSLKQTKESTELERIKKPFRLAIQLLLDFAVGENLSDLSFLRSLDISGFNFFGVAYKGNPITKAMLSEMGCTGVKRSITHREDLLEIELSRQEAIRGKADYLIPKRGIISYLPQREINLLNLKETIKFGHLEEIQMRLDLRKKQGKDFNKYYLDNGWNLTLLHYAIQRGSLEIVKLLIGCGVHPTLPTTSQEGEVTSASLANKLGFSEIAVYLENLKKI